MYFLLQGYISPLLISYKIAQEDREKPDDVPVIELVSGG